jgi:hypothetical protein
MSVPEITVELPPMYYPMPLRCHPGVGVLEERGLAWMAGHGFCSTPASRERVVGSRTALFSASLCPEADLERLQVATDWGYLMFVFDDVVCDEDATGDMFSFTDLALRVIRTLEAPHSGVMDPGHPFTAPVTDLAGRVRRLGTPGQVQRLVDAHRTWLFGVSRGIEARRRRLLPSANDYLLFRPLDSATSPVLAWLQFSEPEEIPASQAAAPRVRALAEMAGTVATLDDDLYSRGKDLWFAAHHGTSPGLATSPSSVDVFMAESGCPHQEAMEQVAALRDRITDRFTELCGQVLDTVAPPLARYLFNLTCLIRGDFEYGLIADRYRNPDGKHPGAVNTIGTVSDKPAQTGPPPIPSISWWWTV